jgi:hypothetical protein
MANPLTGVITTVEKVPPLVWVGGGVIVVGYVAYRSMHGASSSSASEGTATAQSVAQPLGSQQTDLAAVASELSNNETNAIAAVGAQANEQQAALAQSLQTQQQIDAQSQQGFETLILGGLNNQESQYAALQGQTENFLSQAAQNQTAQQAQTEQYLNQNQATFAQAASTFGIAQSGMAASLADLWGKLTSININPTPTAPILAPVKIAPPAASGGVQATYQNPTGSSATWGGLTGSQIQSNFLSAAGGDPVLAQHLWETQHAAEVARG